MCLSIKSVKSFHPITTGAIEGGPQMGVCLLPESANQCVVRRSDDFEVVTFVAIDWKPQSDVSHVLGTTIALF